jgi:hypothetical protein
VENELRVMKIKRWREKRLKTEKNGHPSLRRPRFLKDRRAKKQAKRQLATYISETNNFSVFTSAKA